MAISTRRALGVLLVLAAAVLVAGCGGDDESLTVGNVDYKVLEAEEQAGRVAVRVSVATTSDDRAADILPSIRLVDGKGETHAASGDANLAFTLSTGGDDDGKREYEFELAFDVPSDAVAGSKLRVQTGGASGDIDLGLD